MHSLAKSARNVLSPGRWWSKKEVDTPQAAAPEPKNFLTNKDPDAMRPLDATADSATGRLGSRLHVKGDITGTEDLLIDGSVEGLIQLDGKLTVGPTAKLLADINARVVVIYGQVKGNVHAKGRIEIKKDGSVIGNLKTAQIMIEDGAEFKGSIEIDRSNSKEVDQKASSRAASASAGAGPKSV
jgi:cytoskeletal protein CcmA (bactofilin family)